MSEATIQKLKKIGGKILGLAIIAFMIFLCIDTSKHKSKRSYNPHTDVEEEWERGK